MNQVQRHLDGESNTIFVSLKSNLEQEQDILVLSSSENFTDETEIKYNRNVNLEDIYQNFTYDMSLLNIYDEEDAKQLACDYTCKRIISFVVTVTRLSFVANLHMAWVVFKAIYEMVRKEYNNDSILAVLEKSPNKGYHLHILHVSTKITTKKELGRHECIFF